MEHQSTRYRSNEGKVQVNFFYFRLYCRNICEKNYSFRSEQERKRSNSQGDSLSGKGLPHQLRLGPDDVKKESDGGFYF